MPLTAVLPRPIKQVRKRLPEKYEIRVSTVRGPRAVRRGEQSFGEVLGGGGGVSCVRREGIE
jgi:hypothetical protein